MALTPAEKQRRYRQRLKKRLATVPEVSDRDPRKMTMDEMAAEITALDKLLEQNPVKRRIGRLSREMERRAYGKKE